MGVCLCNIFSFWVLTFSIYFFWRRISVTELWVYMYWLAITLNSDALPLVVHIETSRQALHFQNWDFEERRALPCSDSQNCDTSAYIGLALFCFAIFWFTGHRGDGLRVNKTSPLLDLHHIAPSTTHNCHLHIRTPRSESPQFFTKQPKMAMLSSIARRDKSCKNLNIPVNNLTY